MTAILLAQLPELELISVAATGVNNIDLAACKKLGIAVCHIQNYAQQQMGHPLY